MVNTLQFTRTTKLAWRFPENTEDTEGEQEGDSGRFVLGIQFHVPILVSFRVFRVFWKAPSKLGGSCELQRVHHDKRSKVM
jgi:hypothetical protein